jgi:hydrogenase-4 membrane subunit HyfE
MAWLSSDNVDNNRHRLLPAHQETLLTVCTLQASVKFRGRQLVALSMQACIQACTVISWFVSSTTPAMAIHAALRIEVSKLSFR